MAQWHKIVDGLYSVIKCTAGATCSVLVQVVVSLSVSPALLRTDTGNAFQLPSCPSGNHSCDSVGRPKWRNKPQTRVPSIPNLQIPRGEKFIGRPASAKPLQHKPVYEPEAINMHQDGGNTGTIDYAGPLGNNLELTSALEGLHILL